MSSETTVYVPPGSDELELYRTVSKHSVCSLIFAFLSILGLAFPALTLLAFAAAVLGVVALVRIRRYPNELTGKVLASIGLTAGSVLLVASVSFHLMIYITEVPEGYHRISFADLQPTRERSDLPIAPLAQQLDGKKVFIKGYVHPGVSGQGNIRYFVLVRDMGTCCFGGQPKLTDMVEVTLQDPYRIRYSARRRNLGGIFKLTTQDRRVSGGLQGGYFQLAADYLK